MRLTYLAIGLVLLMVAGGLIAVQLRPPSLPKPQDWKLEQLKGGSVSMSDYKGQVVLVNFWASWCGDCRDEIPDIIQTYNKYHSQGFSVLAINYGESTKDARDFMVDYAIAFPVLLDPGKKIAAQYGVATIPSSYLIDRSGKVVEYAAGRIDVAKFNAAVGRLVQSQ
jgi:peroxiredoxin